MRRRMPIWKRVTFTVVTLAAFVLLAEGGALVANGIWGVADDIRVYVPGPVRSRRPTLMRLDPNMPKRCEHGLQVRQPERRLRDRVETMNPEANRLAPPTAKPLRKQVFVVGASAAWGDGVEYAETFSGRLASGGKYQVHNAAVFGADSEMAAFTVKNIIDCHQPDLIVAFLGSDFFQWQYERQERTARDWHLAFSRKSMFYRCLIAVARQAFRPKNAPPGAPPGNFHNPQLKPTQRCEIDADYREPKFFDAAGWHNDREHYLAFLRNNLEQIIGYARHHGVKVLLTTIPFNYRMCPARFVKQPLAGTVADRAAGKTARRRFDAGLQQLRAGRNAEAGASFIAATEAAPEAPLPWYFAGQAQVAQGDLSEADRLFRQARETTVGNLGSVLSANDVIREVAAQTDTPLADVAATFADGFDHEFLSDQLFRDFCHPNVAGHERIAASLAPVVDTLLGAR